MKGKTFKGASISKSEINAYSVGLMRLSEMCIANSFFEREDIELIGWHSINRKKMVIGKIGNLWCIHECTLETEQDAKTQHERRSKFRAYYVIKGKRIIVLHPSTKSTTNNYEVREHSKPLHLMTTDEIFCAGGVGRLCRKREGKANSRNDIGKYKNKLAKSLYNY